MSLKTGIIFKDFNITANTTNTAVTFNMVSPLDVKVKNDNFATQVEILDTINDLFDYKYITFDKKTFFEITDTIANENLTTFFIQYVSTLKNGFGVFDDNFSVESITINNLTKLGLSINDIIKIFDERIDIKSTETVFYYNNTTPNDLALALKIRMSDIPSNTFNYLTATGFDGNTTQANLREKKYTCINQSYNDFKNNNDFFAGGCSNSDFAYVFFLFLPTGGNGVRFQATFNIYDGDILRQQYNTVDLLNTLKIFISDLTLSVELTPITTKTLQYGNGSNPSGAFPNNSHTITANEFRINSNTTNPQTIRRDILKIADTKTPIFIVGGLESASGALGSVEVYNHIKLDIKTNPNCIYLSLFFLNNTIDLSQLQKKYITIKRMVGKTRIYIDVEKNNFVDITNSIEYIKNSYSNFEAYSKSNLLLAQQQEQNALKQQQKQEKQIAKFNTVSNLINITTNPSTFLSPYGAVSGALGAGADFFLNQKQLNITQQNDVANLKLKQKNELELLQKTVVPSNEIQGDTNLSQYSTTTQSSVIAYEIKYLELDNDIKRELLLNYLIENQITEKVYDVSEIKKPNWSNKKYFQAKIRNRSKLNNRKDFYIYVE